MDQSGLDSTVRPTPGIDNTNAPGLLARLGIEALGHNNVTPKLVLVPVLGGLHEQNPFQHLHLPLADGIFQLENGEFALLAGGDPTATGEPEGLWIVTLLSWQRIFT